MCLKPLKTHYSMENPASVYDEEAMTALELAGRTTKKVNECVELVNQYGKDAEAFQEHVEKEIPTQVTQAVKNTIESGEFADEVDKFYGELGARVDNIIAEGSESSAEMVDTRIGTQGMPYTTAGNAVRGESKQALMVSAGEVDLFPGSINAEDGTFYLKTSNRLLSTLIKRTDLVYIKVSEAMRLRAFYYDKNLSYIGYSSFATLFTPDRIDSEAVFIRFIVCNEDDTDISVHDLTADNFQLATVDSLEKAGIKGVKDIPFINGTVDSTGKLKYANNRLVSPVLSADFTACMVQNYTPGGSYFALFACYDQDMQWIGNTEFTYGTIFPTDDVFTGAKYMRIVLRATDHPELSEGQDHRITLWTKDTTLVDDWNTGAPEFIHEEMNTAYSEVYLMSTINTERHFEACSYAGFNALKGDVQITADNQLIMTHDAGYTLDADGKITAYDKDNSTAWISKNWTGEVENLVYDDDQNVCTFEKYLVICKKHGHIAYITLRDINIPTVVAKVMHLLKEYGMVHRAVINSYTLRTLETVRLYSRSIPVSLVINHGELVTATNVAQVKNLGNGILTLFYCGGGVADSVIAYQLTQSADILTSAKDAGVVLHMAQIGDRAKLRMVQEYGITGYHLTKLILTPKPTIWNFHVNISESGNAVTFDTTGVGGADFFEHVISATPVCEVAHESLLVWINNPVLYDVWSNLATVCSAFYGSTMTPLPCCWEAGTLVFPYKGDGAYSITISI